MNGLKSDLGLGSSDADKKTDAASGLASTSVDPVKARKEREKREEAQRQYEEERRKKREKEEYQREKMRENIRQKYGIEKKKSNDDIKAVKELKRDYDMTDEEFAEFEGRVAQDRAEKQAKEHKFDEKLKRRAAKKELKQGVKDSCKQQ